MKISLPAIYFWLFTLGVVAILATLPLWAGGFPSTSDMRDVYIPLEDFFQKHQKNGQLPAWQPLAAWGFPAIASGQIGFFYPPLLIARQLIPFPYYLSCIVIIHLFALSLGTFLLAKRHQLSSPAAFFTTTTFVYGAFIWQHFIHFNIFLIIAWLPWQLWLTHRLNRPHSITTRDIAALSLIIAMPYLVGQFQIPTLMAAATISHLFYLRWNSQRRFLSELMPVIITPIIVLGLIAVQVLPTLELLPYSSRSDNSEQFDVTRANQYSYPIYHLPTLLFPRFYDTNDNYWGRRLEFEYGFFVGTLPLLLITRWFWRTRHSLNGVDRYFAWLALITFLLALGSLSPFRLIGLEPSLWFFSAPARWLLFTSLAVSLLAGRALDTLNVQLRDWSPFITKSLLYIIALVVLGNAVLFSPLAQKLPSIVLELAGADNSYNQEKIASLLSSARNSSISLSSPYTYLPLAILTAAVFLSKKSARTQRLVIISLTTIELLILNPPLIITDSWQNILKTPVTFSSLPQGIKEQQSRLYSIRENTDSGAFFTNPNSRGGAVENQLRDHLLVPLIHTQYDIAGVEWPASLDYASQEPVLNALRRDNSYEIIDIHAAEQLNIGAIIAPNKISLPKLSEAAQKVTKTALTTTYDLNPAPRFSFVNENNQVAESIQSVKVSSTGNIHLEMNAQAPGKLIIRDTYYPGWQAFIDNQEATIRLEPPFFRNLSVPAGRHTITLNYQPQSIFTGLVISFATLGVCLVLSIFTKKLDDATLKTSQSAALKL